jgi:hypothetical protein
VDVERNGQTVGVSVAAKDGKARHPDYIPKASGLFLPCPAQHAGDHADGPFAQQLDFTP